jgi:hypothetical protein
MQVTQSLSTVDIMFQGGGIWRFFCTGLFSKVVQKISFPIAGNHFHMEGMGKQLRE